MKKAHSYIFFISTLLFFSQANAGEEYKNIIKGKQEYKNITQGSDKEKCAKKNCNGKPIYYGYPTYHGHYHYYPAQAHYSDPYSYGPPTPTTRIGTFYFGLGAGTSVFNYDDIDDGDATRFYFGYRPNSSHFGFEISLIDTGNADVVSLESVDLEVEGANFAITINSTRAYDSPLNFFGKLGLYSTETTLRGPVDDVIETSSGLSLGGGFEYQLSHNFAIRADVEVLSGVEDFADDRSVSIINFGGHFAF